MRIGSSSKASGELLTKTRPTGGEAATGGEEIVVVDGVGVSTRHSIPGEDNRPVIVVFVNLVPRRPRRRTAARLLRSGCGGRRGGRGAHTLDEPGSVTLRLRHEVVDHPVDVQVFDLDTCLAGEEQETPAPRRVDPELVGRAGIGTTVSRAHDQPGAAYNIGALRARETRPRDYRQQHDGCNQPPRSATVCSCVPNRQRRVPRISARPSWNQHTGWNQRTGRRPRVAVIHDSGGSFVGEGHRRPARRHAWVRLTADGIRILAESSDDDGPAAGRPSSVAVRVSSDVELEQAMLWGPPVDDLKGVLAWASSDAPYSQMQTISEDASSM